MSLDVPVWESLYGRRTDEAHVAELATTLDTKLDEYGAIIRKQEYLAGDASRFRPPNTRRPRTKRTGDLELTELESSLEPHARMLRTLVHRCISTKPFWKTLQLSKRIPPRSRDGPSFIATSSCYDPNPI
ncbi:hypothetical protein BV22DRAFT_607770 [Leucogyrophana mollusca]|uniref:Uncharacterized protein n=1 Tax=Leucogyrophana mollusca TaxID=85980 RepID=A0ACB8BBP5_9AGAM|nr:hypothetical protein BV22DRAFT_607770 [Leucogyrophana mollusca]